MVLQLEPVPLGVPQPHVPLRVPLGSSSVPPSVPLKVTPFVHQLVLADLGGTHTQHTTSVFSGDPGVTA